MRHMRQHSTAFNRAKLPWLVPLLVGIMCCLSVFSSFPNGQAQPVFTERYQAANVQKLLADPKAIPVKVGAYIESYHDLSLQQRRFTAEGYYWTEWPQAMQDILDAEKIAPSEMLELSNQIDEWDSKIEDYGDDVTKLENGNYNHQTRFSANFYIPKIDLRRAPFANQELPIVIEVLDDGLAQQIHNVVLVPSDGEDSMIGSDAQIDGFKLESVTMRPASHSYGTSWGLGQGDLTYSAVQVTSNLVSSGKAGFGLSVLPLLIVMGIVLLSPSVAGQLGDVRLAIPSTGLLTLIFLQQSYRATLPPLDYLTFLDWLYACSYLVSIATFILFVWGSNVYEAAPEGQQDVTLNRINRVDLIFQLGSVAALAATAILAWISC